MRPGEAYHTSLLVAHGYTYMAVTIIAARTCRPIRYRGDVADPGSRILDLVGQRIDLLPLGMVALPLGMVDR